MKYFYFFILNFFSTLKRKFFLNIIYIFLSLALFSVLTLFDNYIFNKIFELQNLFIEPLETIGNILNFIFETRAILSILLIAFIFSYILKDEKSQKKLLYSIFLIIISISFSLILKLIFSRERPYVSYNPYNIFMWKNFLLENYNKFFSLPSGHVINLISTYILWRGNSIKRILFNITLILVAFFRIYSLQHWPSDIFAGILFSIFMIVNNKSSIIEE